jgi:hypothetical protein
MSLKTGVSPQVFRIATRILQYNFEFKHIAGKRNTLVDAISRIPAITSDGGDVGDSGYNITVRAVRRKQDDCKFIPVWDRDLIREEQKTT